MKEKIKQKLEQFGFNYSESPESVTVYLDYSLRILIRFYDNKLVLEDKLTGWNFITGMIELSVKQSLLFNWVGMLFVTLLVWLADRQAIGFNFMPFFLFAIFWLLFWTGYYVIKSEMTKREIRSWV